MQDTETSLMDKGWLSPEEAVRYSGIGRTRLYRYLTTGMLPSAKLGRTRHIRRRDLDDFLNSLIETNKKGNRT